MIRQVLNKPIVDPWLFKPLQSEVKLKVSTSRESLITPSLPWKLSADNYIKYSRPVNADRLDNTSCVQLCEFKVSLKAVLIWLLTFPAMSHFFLVMSPPFSSLLGDCLKITTNSSVRQILSVPMWSVANIQPSCHKKKCWNITFLQTMHTFHLLYISYQQVQIPCIWADFPCWEEEWMVVTEKPETTVQDCVSTTADILNEPC